jgi:Leucine-rich repeat (LRR) protein
MKTFPLHLLTILIIQSLAKDVPRHEPGQKDPKLTCDPNHPKVGSCCGHTHNKKGTTIQCVGKDLKAVPIDLPEDTIYLKLRFNRITTIKNNTFAKLSKLTFLDLTQNFISSLEENGFNGLGELEELRLGENKCIVLTSNTLAPLKSLKILKFSKNENLSIDNDVFQHSSSLETLDAGYCGLRNISFLRSLRNSHNLSHIFLDGNNLGNLTKDLFDGLVSKGLYLNLNGSEITHIENGTFSVIKKVTHLDLTNNDIGESFPGVLYGLHNMKILSLANIGLRNPVIFCQMWDYLRPNKSVEASLIKLNLAANRLKKIQDNNFAGLGNLQYLNLSDNPLTERISKGGFRGLANLNQLHLRHCTDLTSFPKFAPENGTDSFTPVLRYLSLAWSPVVTLRKSEVFKGLESLNYLDLSHTFVRGIILDSLKHLETLHLQYCSVDELPKINSTTLIRLYISNNEFFLENKMHQNWIVPNLEILELDGNKFNNMSGEDTMNFFSIFPKLKTLTMGKMGLYFLKEEIFDKMPNLEDLDLSSNPLGSNLTSRWFKSLKKLKKLEMRDCQITTITKENFPSDTKFLEQLKHLDLRNNPFNCDCTIQWFYDLIKEDRIHLSPSNKAKGYTCKSPQVLNGSPLMKFQIPDHCHKAYQLLLSLSLSGVSILVTFFIGLALLSRYRWHIKYKLFKLKVWYYGSQYEELDGSKYKYDFHVHYDDDDLPWVQETLIPELEDKRGYRLYIKDRDSRLCEYICENICYSIENSYKTILCISNQFTRNAWSQFLLNLVIEKLVNEKKNILVCILLEEIEGENLLETLKGILTEKSYIKLPEDRTEEAMEYFWSCLDEALHIPVIPHHNDSNDLTPGLANENQPLLQNVC